jgi:hypothetical protein
MKDFYMKLSIACLIRKIIEAIDLTSIGQNFIEITKKLESEIPEIKRGIIKPERKEEACNKLANAYLAFIQKATGQGLSEEKSREMTNIIKGLQDKNDFKGLVSYPYHFALAWKTPVLKEAIEQEAHP